MSNTDIVIIILLGIGAMMLGYAYAKYIGTLKSKIKTLENMVDIGEKTYQSAREEIVLLKLMISTGYAETDIIRKSDYIMKDYEAGMKILQEKESVTN